MNFRLAITTLLLCGAPAVSPTAMAETFATCKGFIDTVPTTISAQGVYCLRKDLATAQTSGAAITINANNVTIDCNDFKLGGLAAGDGSEADGIHAEGRQNIAVRHCGIRGFSRGIYLMSGAGYVVEDNRLDNNLFIGIRAEGENSIVRRNAVYDTGGQSGNVFATGIIARADVLDNTVNGVSALTNRWPTGIVAYGTGTRIDGNRVSVTPAFDDPGVNDTIGIELGGHDQSVVDNHVIAAGGAAQGTGIYDRYNAGSFCSRNTVAGFPTAIASCEEITGNASH